MQVMEEVMAKSKKFKAERQLQREDDLNETEVLDNQFKALQGERLMAGLLRPTGKQAPRPGKDTDPLGAVFDVMRRELVFDAKAKVDNVLILAAVSMLAVAQPFCGCCVSNAIKPWLQTTLTAL